MYLVVTSIVKQMNTMSIQVIINYVSVPMTKKTKDYFFFLRHKLDDTLLRWQECWVSGCNGAYL